MSPFPDLIPAATGRRPALLLAAAVCAVAISAGAGSGSPSPAAAGTASAAAVIQAENALPGTTSWYVATPDQSSIAGYASEVSYAAGDTVTLYVDSKGDPFSYTVYRMGYYQGLGGRDLLTGHIAANAAQPTPTITDNRKGGARLLLTAWHPSTSFTVDSSWVSGYYLVKLQDDVNGKASYACFVVRSTDPAPLVVNLSTNTWQAYNNWGGLSLYSGAHVVSFQRPYDEAHGAGQFFRFDRPLVEYLEQRGMPVSYATDEDARAHREVGPQTRLLVVDAHGEYQDLAERRYLAAQPARGVSLAFTGGNDLVWQSRFDDADHQMSVWRIRRLDPVDQGSGATIRWEQVGWHPNAVTGEMQAWGRPPMRPERAYATGHWAWKGAAVSPGTRLGPLEGNEFDGVVVNSSTSRYLTVLARSPMRPRSTNPAVPPPAQAMTILERPGRGFVFSAGMTNFDWYLDYPGVTPAAWIDPKPGKYPTGSQVSQPVRRLVGNLLARALDISNPEPPASRPPRVTPPMRILSPRRGQAVFSAPGRPAVTWADAPAGTVSIRIVYAGRRVAVVGPRRDFWIGARGVPLSGFHTIGVRAIDAHGHVLAQSRRRVDFRPPGDPIFRANSRGLKRLWAATPHR